MSMHKRHFRLGLFAAAATLALGSALGASGSAWAGSGYQMHYGFGTAATEAEIKELAIAIPPSGEHLPAGSGTWESGKKVYDEKCVACHGEALEGIKEVGGDKLIGGRGTLEAGGAPVKTIESYWPYATTVFDFVRRAMPFDQPGSLTDEEVYAVTAYILGEAGIVEKGKVIDAKSLPAVEMPNRDGFIPDPRPDVFNYN
jgi:cytochrome c